MTISSYSSLKLFKWPHLPYQCEVFNMFTHLIPQAGLSRIERGVARGLTGHYMGKAIEVDHNYGGVRPVEVGKVQRKLETFGEVSRLVFGAFGECV